VNQVKIVALVVLLSLGSTVLAAQTLTWLWANSAGGSDNDDCSATALDSQGNIYVTGNFYGTVKFGPYRQDASGESDIFVAKLDPAGNWLWAVRAGGTNTDKSNSIAVDQAGNAYLTGSFRGTASFGPYTLATYDVEQIFVAKIDFTGHWVWAVQAGGIDWDSGYGIVVDQAGYV
jgi:hypothetical protein